METAGQKIVPTIHRNQSVFKTLQFNAQCLQDFLDFSQP
jgi:hypothetical protein